MVGLSVPSQKFAPFPDFASARLGEYRWGKCLYAPQARSHHHIWLWARPREILRSGANIGQPFQGAQAKGQSLGPTPDPDEASYRSVFPLLFDAQIGERILAWIVVSWQLPKNKVLGVPLLRLTKYTASIQVGAQELAVSLEAGIRGEAAHIRTCHELFQEIPE